MFPWTAAFQGCARPHATAVFRPYRSKYNTIGHEILDIELAHNRNPQNYALLDSLIEAAKTEIPPQATARVTQRQDAVRALKTIDDLLLKSGFKYKENRLLSTSLQDRQIDCDCRSAVYLSIAEEISLPIRMVRAPGHTFVRWHFTSRRYVNWETTIGVEKDDTYYIDRHHIAPVSRGVSAMRSLDLNENRTEILANAFLGVGVEWLSRCRTKEAIASLGEAVARDPLYETPYYNLGLAYYRNGEIAKAIMWCQFALKLNPNHLKSCALLMSAHIRAGDAPGAFRYYAKVIALDPDYYSEEAIAGRQNIQGLCG